MAAEYFHLRIKHSNLHVYFLFAFGVPLIVIVFVVRHGVSASRFVNSKIGNYWRCLNPIYQLSSLLSVTAISGRSMITSSGFSESTTKGLGR